MKEDAVKALRQAGPEDVEILGNIAYDTGFFGKPAEVYFTDRRLFADLWVRPYLYGPGCCNLVAELRSEAVGYIVGSYDLRLYERYMLTALVPFLLRRWLNGDYPGWRGSLRFLVRVLRYRSRHAPAKTYPAQLHINLLPRARGQGLGQALLEAHLDCLRAKGVPGVQLSTTRENEAAIGLYEKCGFGVFEEYPLPLWHPWLGHDAVHVVMVKELG